MPHVRRPPTATTHHDQFEANGKAEDLAAAHDIAARERDLAESHAEAHALHRTVEASHPEFEPSAEARAVHRTVGSSLPEFEPSAEH